MDAALGAAAQALSRFDPLAALKRVALRDDADALALRGIAMAQLGDYAAAQKLLGRAGRAFGQSGPRARARCLAAQGEVALACRDLTSAERALDAALLELDAQGDRANALFVRVQRVRRLVLLGAVSDAAAMLRSLAIASAPPRLRAQAELVGADIALRALDPRAARAALARARSAARVASIPSLGDEVERVARELDAPVARVARAGTERLARLDEVAAILGSKDLVVDACRRTIRAASVVVPLVTRPVLLALGVALARAVPGDVTREALAEATFGARRITDSTRVRLRVEIGRLRRAIAALGAVEATARGYALRPRDGADVVVLLPPAPGEASALLALLRGGESWSTSALAAAMGTSQRTVQRALLALRDAGRVEGLGGGRAQRWVARPPEGFATTLLLVVRGPSG
jgi:DNA-binding transcriptional ArsR family regulator